MNPPHFSLVESTPRSLHIYIYIYIYIAYTCAHKNPAKPPPRAEAHRQRLQGGVAQLMALAGVQLHVQHGHAQTFHVEVLRRVNLPALEMAVFIGN